MTAPKTPARLLAGSALLLALALPAARAQTPADTPAPATTPSTVPAPADTTAPQVEALPPPAKSAAKRSSRFRFGPEVGVYLPTSSKARSQFGSSWVTLGLGLGDITRATAQGSFGFDLQILYQSRHGNHAFLAPVGVSYRRAFTETTGDTIPYYGVTADINFADIRSGDYDVHSGIRTGFGGSALLGLSFGGSGYLEARYLAVSRIKGFDLSGLNLTAGYRF